MTVIVSIQLEVEDWLIEEAGCKFDMPEIQEMIDNGCEDFDNIKSPTEYHVTVKQASIVNNKHYQKLLKNYKKNYDVQEDDNDYGN